MVPKLQTVVGFLTKDLVFSFVPFLTFLGTLAFAPNKNWWLPARNKNDEAVLKWQANDLLWSSKKDYYSIETPLESSSWESLGCKKACKPGSPRWQPWCQTLGIAQRPEGVGGQWDICLTNYLLSPTSRSKQYTVFKFWTVNSFWGHGLHRTLQVFGRSSSSRRRWRIHRLHAAIITGRGRSKQNNNIQHLKNCL